MTRERRNFILRILVIIAVVLAVIDVALLLTKSSKRVVNEKSVFNYTENSEIDYKVFSEENDELKELTSPYKKDNISSITALFKYSFLGDLDLDFNYTNSVVAVLTTRDLKGNKIYSKEFVLANEETLEVKKYTGFNINKNVTIDYNLYTEIISNYLNEKAIDPANTKTELVVILKVVTNTLVEDEAIESKSATKLNIPINVDNFTINESVINNDKTVTSKVSEVIKNETLISALYTLYGIAILILIIVFINYFINRDYVNSHKSEYKKVRKALRDYEEMIFHTCDMPDLKNKNVTNIDKFEVLLALAKKYDLLITMVEKDDYITFVIINKQKAWTYTINKDNQK